MKQKFSDYNAEYWIELLKMIPHPEGGYFKEVYRPDLSESMGDFPQGRRCLTTIYYLLENSDFSAFHRIKSPESWFFHKGEPLLIYSFEQGKLICRELSDNEEGQLQITIEPNTWFAARLKNSENFVLVSCAVAPGFEYCDFELANRDTLMIQFPNYGPIIEALTRE